MKLKKKEAHGPHRSPEKPVQISKALITCIYTIKMVLEKKILKSKLASNSRAGNYFNFVNIYFCNFVIFSLWKKVWPFTTTTTDNLRSESSLEPLAQVS